MIRNIFVLTMFPEIYDSFTQTGIIGKALRNERSKLSFNFEAVLLSDFSDKGFKGVDSSSYGGGPGMVMRADVLKNAYDFVKKNVQVIK